MDHKTEIEGKSQCRKKKNLRKNLGWLSEMIGTLNFPCVTVYQELIGIKANQQNTPTNENENAVNVDEG